MVQFHGGGYPTKGLLCLVFVISRVCHESPCLLGNQKGASQPPWSNTVEIEYMSVLLLHSRLAPELVTGTVKESKLLGATVLKHRADQQQTKSFVYISCSSCPKLCCCSALCFKTVAPSSLLFLTVPVHHVNKLSPAINYVWFGWHWGLEKSLMSCALILSVF